MIRTAVRNHGGGHANHQFFWEILGPKAGGSPKGAIGEAIKRDFGSFERFQSLFTDAVAKHFGSGVGVPRREPTDGPARDHVAARPGQRAVARQAGTGNALSVLIELQADCYAGVWGHFARQRKLLEPGDVESGLAAAAAIGDDRLQRQARGQVSPESSTHGSSAQRVRWFRAGLDSGDVRQCDIFTIARL